MRSTQPCVAAVFRRHSLSIHTSCLKSSAYEGRLDVGKVNCSYLTQQKYFPKMSNPKTLKLVFSRPLNEHVSLRKYKVSLKRKQKEEEKP